METEQTNQQSKISFSRKLQFKGYQYVLGKIPAEKISSSRAALPESYLFLLLMTDLFSAIFLIFHKWG